MSKHRFKSSYLEIPEDFRGFTYQEVKIRRTVMQLRCELLRQKFEYAAANLKSSFSPASRLRNSKVGKFLGLAGNTHGARKGNTGSINRYFKYAMLGISAYKFVKNLLPAKKAK